MFANLTSALDFHSKALVLRAERQRVIASNIANADTPGYVGRDVNFQAAMEAAVGGSRLSLAPETGVARQSQSISNARHIPLQASTASLGSSRLDYTVQSQPAMDGNSVDLDRERASFVDNSVRYEATLRFINGQSKTLLSAIQGQ
jgi:flagellar basal-body rod protein FlgB